MEKLTIITKREVNFPGSQGNQIHGYMYGALYPDGAVVEFFSNVSTHEPIKFTGRPSYNEAGAIEVNLITKLGRTKDGQAVIKYAEKE